MSVLKEINKINIKDRDAYFLASTPSNIIINSDSKGHQKEGVIIYDYHLNKKKEILFSGEKVGIYSCFKKFSKDELLFYCPDDECIIYINLIAGDSRIISLPDPLKETILSPIYWWEQGVIILSDYKENFYTLSICEKLIHRMDIAEVKKNYPRFFSYYHAAINAVKVYPSRYQYVMKNEDHELLELHDLSNKTVKTVPNLCKHAHDYEYKSDTFVWVSEKEIVVLKDKKNLLMHINPSKNYIFLKALLLEDDTLVVLSNFNSENELIVYSIDS